MKAAAKPRRRRRQYVVSGYYRTKARVMRSGVAGLDGRTRAAQAIAQDRADLVAHVGGAPSATQLRVVDGVLMLDLLIAAAVHAVQLHGPVDRRRNVFRPVARELAAMIERRHRLCADLGWQPAPPPRKDWRTILAERATTQRAADAVTQQEPAGRDDVAPTTEEPTEPARVPASDPCAAEQASCEPSLVPIESMPDQTHRNSSLDEPEREEAPQPRRLSATMRRFGR